MSLLELMSSNGIIWRSLTVDADAPFQGLLNYRKDHKLSSLEVMFSKHGLPESLTSDNGAQLISAEFKEYMEKEGIRHHRTTAKWPQANGQVER